MYFGLEGFINRIVDTNTRSSKMMDGVYKEWSNWLYGRKLSIKNKGK